MATKIAADGPGGPVVAGDQLQRDRTCTKIYKNNSQSFGSLFQNYVDSANDPT